MKIQPIKTPEEIKNCLGVFLELRPHLKDIQIFLDQIILQQKEGYQIRALTNEKEEIAGVIGYRCITTLAWGKILYIDDLIVRKQDRGKKYGSALLKYAYDFAHSCKCEQIHLDTGYTRHAAHKLYLNQGFELICHHLSLDLKK